MVVVFRASGTVFFYASLVCSPILSYIFLKKNYHNPPVKVEERPN